MESDHEELYLQKLKRFVYDEDKIVTAVWLSKTFNLDIKSCRNLLNQFVEDQKSSSQSIGASYILTGTMLDLDTEQLTVMIVKELELEIKKKLFHNAPSQSIYSVQKSKDVNLNSIALVDMFNLHPDSGPILGSFVSSKCIKRDNLRTSRVLPSVSRAPSTDKSKASHLFANKTSTLTKTTQPVQVEVKKEPEVKKKDTKKLTKQGSNDKMNKQGNSIANMFAKAPPPKEKKEAKPKVELREAMAIDDDDDDDDDDADDAVAEAEDTGKQTTKANGKLGKDSLYDSGTDEEAKKVEEKNKSKKQSNGSAKKKTNRNKRQRQDQSTERAHKKRKRIQEYVESDDDLFASNDEKDESADIIESDDEPAVQKLVKPFPEKNRKRKFVDKTYTDEDGYIVTKKEYVYDSNEEDDDKEEDKENPQNMKPPPKVEPKPKKVSTKDPSPSSKNNKSKKKPAKPNNQPTLMSFFSKK